MAAVTVLVALPPPPCSEEHLLRVLRMVVRRFPPASNVNVLVPDGRHESARAAVQSLGLVEIDAAAIAAAPPRCFIAVKNEDGIAPAASAPAGTPLACAVAIDGRLQILNQWLTPETDPFVRHHVFNRCTPPTAEPLFAFGPYTYLFRYPGMGPYNAFGHRAPGDLSSLADRPSHHKVVAVFGGSACWSIGCYEDEVFTHVLEQQLNAYTVSRKMNLRFSVLNFGLPGNVVLNELTTYLLHCDRLQPDIVIAHDGFNDMFYGATSDPNLVRGHDIVYQFNIEEWAVTIMKDWLARAQQPVSIVGDIGTLQPQWPLKIHNLPQDIIRAYARRIRQFRSVVENGGARFILGLQPYIHSKKHHSPAELKYLEGIAVDQTVNEVYKRIPFLYEKLSELLPGIVERNFINFDREFSDLPERDTVFIDFCHLSPVGDTLLADMYSRRIIAELAGGLGAGRVSMVGQL